jgi:hypothetical protein
MRRLVTARPHLNDSAVALLRSAKELGVEDEEIRKAIGALPDGARTPGT